MTEETKEIIQQETPITQNAETTQQEVSETPEQVNWRKYRMEREQERKAKLEAEEVARKKHEENLALQKALEAVVSKPTPSFQNEVELDDDQKIEKKVEELLSKREKQREKERAEREMAELPRRLQSDLKDFNQVCTEENLDYLEYHYPEIAKAYKHMPENYDKWEGIYKLIKKFIPNKESHKESKKAESNLSKPGALSRPGMTQTGDHAPQMLDDAKRAANWERMQKVIKGL